MFVAAPDALTSRPAARPVHRPSATLHPAARAPRTFQRIPPADPQRGQASAPWCGCPSRYQARGDPTGSRSASAHAYVALRRCGSRRLCPSWAELVATGRRPGSAEEGIDLLLLDLFSRNAFGVASLPGLRRWTEALAQHSFVRRTRVAAGDVGGLVRQHQSAPWPARRIRENCPSGTLARQPGATCWLSRLGDVCRHQSSASRSRNPGTIPVNPDARCLA